MLPFLKRNTPFPPIEAARRRPDGLLAAGADLSPTRLLDAYRHGIFPWFSEGDPILWWSPDPRQVLFVDELHVSTRLRRRLKRGEFELRANTSFREVMRACAEPRDGQAGTWITDEMIDAYCALHTMGHAHCVESWREGRLAGGIYGVQIGRMFFGESMFKRETDASKVALATLIEVLKRMGIPMMDCQQETDHTTSLGARTIPRRAFKQIIEERTGQPALMSFGEAALVTLSSTSTSRSTN
jgi:leucyl/phenylalanyl-tRNA--protein transferase